VIVAIDGPDGAGKSTHVELLRGWLERCGVDCTVVSKWDVLDAEHHPEARFLRGTDRQDLTACVAEMPLPARSLFIMWLYAETAARAERLARAGDVVLLDGFWMKHAAAELAYGADRALVETIVAGLGAVDAVLYLDVTPEEALRRKGGALTPYECGLDASRDTAKFLARQAAIRDQLLEWADRDGWLQVEGVTVEEVQGEIRRLVAELLPAASERPEELDLGRP
jgi:thymidylate kinase